MIEYVENFMNNQIALLKIWNNRLQIEFRLRDIFDEKNKGLDS